MKRSLPKVKDHTFAELDNNGYRTQRQFDKVPAKIHGKIEDLPRQTERKAFDNLAYGDFDHNPLTIDQAVERLIADGKWERCTRCGVAKPATKEFFRSTPLTRRGWTQPCRSCDALLTKQWRLNHSRTVWRKRKGE